MLMRRKIKKNKRGMGMPALAWWLIAVVILIVVVAGYIILRQKNVSALGFVKNLFRFGR